MTCDSTACAVSWCYKKGFVFSCSSAVLDVSAQINQPYISHEWQLTFLGCSSEDELATALRKHANVLSSTSVRQDFWGGWRDGGYRCWKIVLRWTKFWCSQSIQEFGHCLVLVENICWGSGVSCSCHPCQAAAQPLFMFPQHSNTTWHQHLVQRPTWQPTLHHSSQGLMPGLSYSPAGQQTGHGERGR